MIIPASQASMSILNMVGGVILLVALFVVILVCLFNLRYYIWEDHPSAERRNWRGWFSLRERENDTKGSKVIKAVEIDCEKGQIVRNPPLTALHPRSKIRRTLWAMTPPQAGIPLSFPLPQVKASPQTPKVHPNVKVPPAVIIKPRSRKNSEASDTSQSTKPPPQNNLPSPPPSCRSTHPSSFEAATGIGMGPTYRPPPPRPPPSLGPFHIQPNAKAADVRNSIVMEFQHYFNPFSWVATGAQEGKDLDCQDEEGPEHSSAPQQGGKKDAVVQRGEVATAV